MAFRWETRWMSSVWACRAATGDKLIHTPDVLKGIWWIANDKEDEFIVYALSVL